MLRIARAALFAVVPAEVLIVILLVSGVALPPLLISVTEVLLLAVFVLEAVVASQLYRAARKDGASPKKALRATYEQLVPLKVRRIIGFDTKGIVSLALLVTGRRHGVPPGATPVAYSAEHNTPMMMFMFAMVIEAVGCDLLLRAIDAPSGLRNLILAIDLYGIALGLAIMAATRTRPHVVSADELRLRQGGFFDLRIPRELISSVRMARNYNEAKMVGLKDGTLALSVGSQTNVVVELTEPVTVTRPLGSQDVATMIRFFADKPGEALKALTVEPADRVRG